MGRFAPLPASKLALGYAALSFALLAMFAMPLWYAWKLNVAQGRSQILIEEIQRFTEVFSAKGIAGVATAIDDQVGTQRVGNRVVLLADPSRARVAGNRGWRDPVQIVTRSSLQTCLSPRRC